MEYLKKDLTKLLEEMLPNGKDVVEETLNDKKINFDHEENTISELVQRLNHAFLSNGLVFL